MPKHSVQQKIPNSTSAQAGEGEYSKQLKEIPVKFREIEKTRHTECSQNVYQYEYGNNIPGGCRTGDGGKAGTCATPATTTQGTNVMIHCGHVLNNRSHQHQPGDAKSGEDMYVENYDTSDANDSGYLSDYTGNEYFTRKLADSDGTYKSTEIVGIITWETIKNRTGDTSFEVKNQGNSTGTTKGHIKGYNVSGEVKNVWTSCNSSGGDSGGPIFHRSYNSDLNRDETYIIGVHAWGKDSDDWICYNRDSGGNAIEYIEEKYNLTV